MARLRSLATSRAAFPLVAALLLVAESVLCLAVIHRVPCACRHAELHR